MDLFILNAILRELNDLLTDHRLRKVHQLGATDLLLDFRLRDGRLLHISTDPQRLGIYLSSRPAKQHLDTLRTDTPFISLFKKYLDGARLISLENLGYDRVIRFEFETEDDGKALSRKLIVSLTGRTANCLILEGERVIASLRERSEAGEFYRDPAPPENRLDPFQCSSDKLMELIAAEGGDLAAAAQKHLLGFTGIYAAELAFMARTSPPVDALATLLNRLYDSPPSPTIYASTSIEILKNEPGLEEFSIILSPIRLAHLASHRSLDCRTINEAADRYFSLVDERRGFLAAKQKTRSQLSSRVKKLRSLVANLERELEGFSEAERHQRYGELLLANLHQAVKTDSGFVVTDFYDASQSTALIPSANKATAQEAAEHYFKLARKARHGREAIKTRLPEARRELDQIESALSRLGDITRLDELNSFSEGYRILTDRKEPTGNKSGRATTGKKQAEKIPGVRRYRSSDGFEIMVGRTDRDNDHLTFRVAKSYDLWFHAADYPGSHVVLRNPGRGLVPPRAVTEAAQLAAKFSQAGGGAKVAVNYCEKKFVTKMKGFAPGQVRLSSFKTLLVEPAEPGERII